MSSSNVVNLPLQQSTTRPQGTPETERPPAPAETSSHARPADPEALYDAEALRDRVADLNRIETLQRHRLEFSIHEGTGRFIVRVMDRDTDEVLRQIPPEELLAVAERLELGEPGSLSDTAA